MAYSTPLDDAIKDLKIVRKTDNGYQVDRSRTQSLAQKGLKIKEKPHDTRLVSKAKTLGAPVVPAGSTAKPKEPATIWDGYKAMGNMAKVIAGSFAKGTVDYAQSVAKHFEREITSSMTNPEQTFAQNLAGFASRFEERMQSTGSQIKADQAQGINKPKSDYVIQATVDTMGDLLSQFVYEDPSVLEGEDKGQPLERKIRAASRAATSFNPLYRYYRGMTSVGKTAVDDVSNIEQKISDWAGLQDQPFVMKMIAGAFESIPQSMTTRGGVAGVPIMLTNAYQNQMESLIEQGFDPYDKKTVTNALASAGIEVASEYIFSLFGTGYGFGKSVLKQVGQKGARSALISSVAALKSGLIGGAKIANPTIKNLIWGLVKKANEEGMEEIVSYIGSALVASVTTNPDDKGFTLTPEEGSLMNLQDLGMSYGSGFLAALALSTISDYTQMKDSQFVAETILEKPISEISQYEYEYMVKTLRREMKKPEVAARVYAALREAQMKVPGQVKVPRAGEDLGEEGAPEAAETEEAAPVLVPAKTIYSPDKNKAPRATTTTTGEPPSLTATPQEAAPELDPAEPIVQDGKVKMGKSRSGAPVIVPEGTPLQKANIERINIELQSNHTAYVTAVAANDKLPASMRKARIAGLIDKAKKVMSGKDPNPYNIQMPTAAPAAPSQPSPVQAPTSPASAPVTPITPQTPQAPPQAPQPATQASAPTQKGRNSRENFTNYLDYLKAKRDALVGRIKKGEAGKGNIGLNQLNAMRSLLSAAQQEILDEEAAIKEGKTTEKIKAPKEVKPKPEPKPKVEAKKKVEDKAKNWADVLKMRGGTPPVVKAGLSYKEYQDMYDEYVDKLSAQYGTEDVLDAPTIIAPSAKSVEEALINPSTGKPTPLSIEELAMLDAILTARDNVDKKETLAYLNKIMAKISDLSAGNDWVPSKPAIRNYLEEKLRSSKSMEALFPEVKQGDTSPIEIAKEIYNGVIQSTKFPWDTYSFEDVMREYATQKAGGVSALGRNVEPIIRAISNVMKALGIDGAGDIVKTATATQPAIPAPVETPAAPKKGKVKSVAAPVAEAPVAPAKQTEQEGMTIKIRAMLQQAQETQVKTDPSMANLVLRPAYQEEISEKALIAKRIVEATAGTKVVFYVSEGLPKDLGLHGFADKRVKGIQFVDATKFSDDRVIETIGHETLHTASHLGVSLEFKEAAAKALGMSDNPSIEEYREVYKRLRPGVADWVIDDYEMRGQLEDEVFAIRAGHIMKTAEFWEELEKRLGNKKGALQKIYDWLKKVVKAAPEMSDEINAYINVMEKVNKSLKTEPGSVFEKGKKLNPLTPVKKVTPPATVVAAPVVAPVAKPEVKPEPVVEKAAPTTDERKARLQAFLAEPRNISKTVPEEDKKVVADAVREFSPRITRLVAKATANKQLIENFNIDVDGYSVEFGENATAAHPKMHLKTIAIQNMNRMAEFYQAVGLGNRAATYLNAYDLMKSLNELTPIEYAAQEGISAEQAASFSKLHSQIGAAGLTAVYFSTTTPTPMDGVKTVKVERKNSTPTYLHFATAPVSASELKANALETIYEEGTEPSAVKPTKAQKDIKASPKTAEKKASNRFATESYDDIHMSVLHDSDTHETKLFFEVKPDGERVNLLRRYGFKVKAPDGYYFASDKNPATADNLLKVIEALKKVESFETVETVAKPEPPITNDMVIFNSISRPTAPTPTQTSTRNVAGGNSAAMARIHAARTMNRKTITVAERIENAKEKFAEVFTRGALPYLTRDQGNLRRLFIRAISAKKIAATLSEQLIYFYNNVSQEEYSLMSDYLVLADVMDDIANMRTNIGNVSRVWGFNSEEEIIAEYEAIRAEINNGKHRALQQALSERAMLYEGVRESYKKAASAVGIDASVLFTHEEYLHHAFTDYEDLIKMGYATNKGLGKTWLYEQRNNVKSPYLTDPALADFIVLQQMYSDIIRFELLAEVKKSDISAEIPRFTPTREGYVDTTISVFGVNFPEGALLNKARSMAETMANEEGITGDERDAFIEAAVKAAEDGMETRMVIPLNIYRTAMSLFSIKERGVVGNLARKVMRQWKNIMIKWPHRILKYNIKNFLGDLDAMLTIYPGAIAYIGKAAKDLHGFYKTKSVSTDLLDYIKEGGLTTGLSEIELGYFQNVASLKFYDKSYRTGNTNAFTQAWARTFGEHGAIENFTQAREQLLRYATYRYLMDRGLKGPAALPTHYGASVASEVLSIKTKQGRAYKMSNDALGAYNDVNQIGTAISDFAIPFFRFKVINITRYYRVMRNMFQTDPNLTAQQGRQIASKAGLVGRVSLSMFTHFLRTIMTGGAFTFAISMFNNLVLGEEEKDLPDYIKNQLHLNLGVHNGQAYYLTGLGSIGDLYGFFGMNNFVDGFKDVLAGRKDVFELAKESAVSAVRDQAISMVPVLTTAIQLLNGEKWYPESTEIRDKWQFIFQQYGLGELYDAAAGLPQKEYGIEEAIAFFVASDTELEYSQYWKGKEIVNKYLEDMGKQPSNPSPNMTEKGNAIYYFKEAIRLEDRDAAIKYLADYVAAGGTRKTYDSSMATLDPLKDVPKKDREEFMDSLSSQDRKAVNKAIAFYDKMIREGDPYADKDLEDE